MSAATYGWHTEAWRHAHAAVARGAHALLVTGAGGLGQRDFALQFAAHYLCSASATGTEACGDCESCHWLAAGTHPDFALVEPPADEPDAERGAAAASAARAKPIGVDQIRELAGLMALTAHHGAGKVVIIHPAESLNLAASNALLKNLEEPPAGVLFILVTDRTALLLPTVRSRCLTITIRLNDLAMAEAWLAAQGCEEPGVQLALCGGAPVEAYAIAADPTWKRRRDFLGRLGEEAADAVALAERFRDLPPPIMLSWLQKWTFDLMLARTCCRTRYHVDMSAQIGKIAGKVDPIALSRLHRSLLAMQRHAHHPLNPRLFLEQMLISYKLALAEGGRA